MKSKTVFLCSNCGNETPKWAGRCPACGQWNTLEEYTPTPAAKTAGVSAVRRAAVMKSCVESSQRASRSSLISRLPPKKS